MAKDPLKNELYIFPVVIVLADHYLWGKARKMAFQTYGRTREFFKDKAIEKYTNEHFDRLLAERKQRIDARAPLTGEENALLRRCEAVIEHRVYPLPQATFARTLFVSTCELPDKAIHELGSGSDIRGAGVWALKQHVLQKRPDDWIYHAFANIQAGATHIAGRRVRKKIPREYIIGNHSEQFRKWWAMFLAHIQKFSEKEAESLYQSFLRGGIQKHQMDAALASRVSEECKAVANRLEESPAVFVSADPFPRDVSPSTLERKHARPYTHFFMKAREILHASGSYGFASSAQDIIAEYAALRDVGDELGHELLTVNDVSSSHQEMRYAVGQAFLDFFLLGGLKDVAGEFSYGLRQKYDQYRKQYSS